MWCPTRNQLSYVALTIFSCIQVALTSNCYAVSPNVLRLGSNETVTIFVEDDQQEVEVSLKNYPNQRGTFFRQSRLVTPERPVIINVNVEAVNLPELEHGRNEAYVMIEVKCGELWRQETPVLVTPTSASHIFLQTDKPIYHPGSKGHIRLLAVDETLKPSRIPFKLEVRNPQGIIVEKHDFFPDRQIMLTHIITLPEHTLLGEWTLVAKYGYKFQQNTTTTFAVEEYVPPRFSVELKTVDYILPNFTPITCRVKATFLNKEPVQGVVTFHFSVKTEVAEYPIGRSKEPTLLNQGEAVYALQESVVQAKLGDKFKRLFQANARLVVEATVTEEATSAKETARNEKAFFSTTPFIISTIGNQRSFKPGINNYVIAQVTYLNGEPAQDVKVEFSAKEETKISTTDKRGIVTFSIKTEINDSNLQVKLSTNDRSFGRDQQAHAELYLKKYEAINNVFIAVKRPDPKRTLKPGDIYHAATFSYPAENFTSVYYVVISRGRVQHMEKLATGQLLERAIGFTVTPEMTPSFRLVVFARVGEHIVSDSIYVNTEPTCSKASEFQIRRESHGLNAEPGALENLIITGTPGTHVGILGVDQALYLLRRKDLLTREKLFQNLDTKDLGCGAGDGTDSAETLSNSGVVLLAGTKDGIAKRTDPSCQERHRSKREVHINIPDKFTGQDDRLRECCAHGLKPDRFLRSCSERVEAINLHLDEHEPQISQECVDAFEECCSYEEEKRMSARSASRDGNDLVDSISNSEDVPRTDFRETWAIAQVTIGDNGKVIFGATLPHSVTTWEVNAVSVAPTGGICVADPLEIVAFKKFFVEVNLPYSVIKNEQIEVPVTVYNHGKDNTKVKVALLGTKDICSGARVGEISAVKTLDVKARRGVTAIFPVIPLDVGVKHIHVRAVRVGRGGDSVIVPLRVERPGVPMSRAVNVLLDPNNQKKRAKRHISHEGYLEYHHPDGKQIVTIARPNLENVVPGSQTCEIGIVGNPLGPALETVVKNPGNLINMPKGCGEQTMAILAPTLYAYQYLKITGQISGLTEETAIGHIRTGYWRMLGFRNKDGSFSVFESENASLWLTSFVIRNLCEARKYTTIDEAVIVSGLKYMIKCQRPDGGFHDNYYLLDSNLLGGVTGDLPLAAYVLLTLQECSQDDIKVEDLGPSRARAIAFIESNLQNTSSAYVLAIAGYALSLSDSPKKRTALKWLENVVSYDEGGNTRHVVHGTTAQTIQATSYALMAFINDKKDRRYLDSYVAWLNKQMQPSGALSSTQDTVVALQALAKYATFAKDVQVDLSCEVTLSSNREFNRTVRIKRDTANVLQKFVIPNAEENISVSAKGIGTAHLYVSYNYNQNVNHDDLCKFNITVNFEERKLDKADIFESAQKSTNTKSHRPPSHERIYTMRACARSLTGKPTGMAILDVGILTGFKPVKDDLNKTVTERRAEYYELSSRSVLFYLASIREDTDTCIEFGLTREFFVGQIQSSYVKAYAYYDPDVSCTEFYSADKFSPLLKLHCKDTEVCSCAEGGCPPEDPLIRFIKDDYKQVQFTQEEQRENLREFACEKVDYVWLGSAKNVHLMDGFISVAFEIKQVLKEGREMERDCLNKTRCIRARDRCTAVNMTIGQEYVVMGKDSEYDEADFCPSQPLYLIDTAAMVIPKKQKFPRDKLIAWFISEFSNIESRCFL